MIESRLPREPWETRDGLRFDGLPPLAAPPPWIVGHWTAGAGLADRVHRVLVQRGLSVHFVGEPDGSMVRMAELDRKCAHAGSRGNRGLGVEMVSRGLPRKGSDDATIPTTIHGRRVQVVPFTDAQLRAWVALCEALAARYGWPRQVPDTDRVLTVGEISRWRGALEHLHLTAKKIDAGMLLCGALRQAGWQAVAPK